jgi:hypothetical protein
MKFKPYYFVTPEHYDRIVDNLIDGAQPPAHLSCDWLTDPLAHGIQVFPVRTYEILRELAHGHSS